MIKYNIEKKADFLNKMVSKYVIFADKISKGENGK
jgi:hypothetical protein